MELCVSIGTILRTEGVSIDDAFRMVAQAGFDGVDFEMCFMMPYVNMLRDEDTPWMSMSDEQMCEGLRPYKDAARKYGLKFLQTHAIEPIYNADPVRFRKYTRLAQQQIMAAAYLESPYIIIHPAHEFIYRDFLEPEQEWELNMDMFSQLLPYLKKYNVTACLENMFTSDYKGMYYAAICQQPEEVNRYVDALNALAGEERFAFCMDTGHAMFAGLEQRNAICQIGKRLKTLHLNDNDGVHDSHQLPYMGSVDWNRVCEGLKRIGYAGTLNFEVSFAFTEKELYPQALAYTAACGRLFEKRIMQA